VGLGITLLSEQAVATELESGSLVRLPVQGTPLRRSWYVLYREGSNLPRSAQAFLELLRSPARIHQALPESQPAAVEA
jgi:DNA-binding transcriptional LysR family regulator